MSTDLDPVVDITISGTGTPLTRVGFGTLAIVCAQGDAELEIETFTNLPDVGTAHTVDSPRYRAARAAFTQDPRPTRIKFINAPLSIAQSVQWTAVAATVGLVTTFKIFRPNGTSATYSYTAIVADTPTLVAAGLVALINAGETGDPASNSGAVLTYANVTNGELFFFEVSANLDTFLDNTADPGYGAQLDAALLLDTDFYGVTPDCTSGACVTAVALWAQANSKLPVISNSDARELTSGGTLGAALVAAGYTRVGGLWHSIPKEYAAVAWLAARLLDPEKGRRSWAKAQLVGITVDTLTTTQRGYLAGDRWSFFIRMGGKNVVHGDATSLPGGGYTFGGRWLDEVHGDDWLAQRSQEDIADLIIEADPDFDQVGINAVCAALLSRMRTAERLKILVKGSSVVNIPLLADIDPDDRGIRTLNGITASALRSSKIHKVSGVNIALSY
jgi:hypothetical protein